MPPYRRHGGGVNDTVGLCFGGHLFSCIVTAAEFNSDGNSPPCDPTPSPGAVAELEHSALPPRVIERACVTGTARVHMFSQ